MTNTKYCIALISAVLLLAGCGKKGDLVLEDDLIVKTDQPTVVTAETPEKPNRDFILDRVL